jgi:hypothetical protein
MSEGNPLTSGCLDVTVNAVGFVRLAYLSRKNKEEI